MSSIPGLPTRGSEVTIQITRVNVHPLCVLVEFWAKFLQGSKADYKSLASDIQFPGIKFKEFEGNPGEHCLVQINDIWHRSRIVSRNGSNYEVFLIDRGMTHTTTTNNLAWGKKEFFQVLPEVEFCVLANVLPRAQEKRWSPMAQEYLRSLTGKSVLAYVQDVLATHRIFVLHIAAISTPMYEMGFAKSLSPVMFLGCVLMSLKSQSGTVPDSQPSLTGAGDCIPKQELFVYPELSEETTEFVTITEVINPNKIYCQLKVFSKELQKLSEKLKKSCEGKRHGCIIRPEMVGCPYAAKGSDGRWYRSIIQQLFPTNAMVEVLNIDYGTKHLVRVENIQPLPAELFRMPVFTYVCSLHGICDRGSEWTIGQIDLLRSLLLHKTVSARFEYHSISEGVYYVTLYGDHHTNLNSVFGSRENSLLDGNKTYAKYSIQSAPSNHQSLASKRTATSCEQVVTHSGENRTHASENLLSNSSHLAVVSHVVSPSEFWIQTENCRQDLDELLDGIYSLYKDSACTDVKEITAGLYCVAKSEDGEFYRAVVTKVGDAKVEVFFSDYGNTEVVNRNDIRTLPLEFKVLPQSALKCSLASVKPKDGNWSDAAIEFFIQRVTNKVIQVMVKTTQSDTHVVQITEPKGQSEADISKLMCSIGFAQWVDVGPQPSIKGANQTSFLPPADMGSKLPSFCTSNENFHSQTTSGFPNKEVVPFKAHMFSIGSIVEVNVSCIESPNDFWCQLVQNVEHLRLLMDDLQEHYANSEFQQDVGNPCVARHPSNGMWYRALVVRKHETPHADVLFVDYGHTETVSIHWLRKISPEFLTLNGQAFRCSLLNLTDPTTVVNDWNEEAKAKFLNFVKTAVSSFGVLKCTVYAVMYNDQGVVYNVVDLETPFESICSILANSVTTLPLKKVNGPSVSLRTYYYSNHNVKVGTEEQVTVTFVNSVGQFYCHLGKNADVIKDLRMKVNDLCHRLEKVKFPKVFASLCFAKYTDGQWYRAQIKQTKPALLVHFVDYGDTIQVDKSDLIPIPKEASDVVSVPIQAVLCGLSDVPPDVSDEANEWFTMTATNCTFNSIIVAKEPDGKLSVELYRGNIQINAEIKKMFSIKTQTNQRVIYQGHKAPQDKTNHAVRAPEASSGQTESKIGFSDSKLPCPPSHEEKRGNQTSTEKPIPVVYDNKKIRRAPLQLYKPPYQRQVTKQEDGLSELFDQDNQNTNYLTPDVKPPSPEPFKEEPFKKVSERLPQLSELPSNGILPGMEADVFISHYNSPMSFYVQRVDEEEEIFSLVERLNDPENSQTVSPLQNVQVGELVQAEFVEDSSWYRAVIKEVHNNNTALIEFVDFGNTAVASVSDMRRLQESVLQLPTYSTHCMVRGVEALAENVLDPEAVSTFKEKIGCDGEKLLKCRFIRQTGSVWEVSLEDNGEAVEVQIPVEDPEVSTEKQVEDEVTTPVCSLREEIENTETTPLDECLPPHLQEEECTDKEELEEVREYDALMEEDKNTDMTNPLEKDLSSDSQVKEENKVDDEKNLSSDDTLVCDDLENTGESTDGAEVATADEEELDVTGSFSEMKSSSDSLDVTCEGDSIELDPSLTDSKPNVSGSQSDSIQETSTPFENVSAQMDKTEVFINSGENSPPDVCTEPSSLSEPDSALGEQSTQEFTPDIKPSSPEPFQEEHLKKVSERLPQLSDLPFNGISPGMEADVFISHYNSPMSFFIQRVDKEEEIFSLVEKLNDPEFSQTVSLVQDVQVGELVQAEFAEDSSWYRAVIKEVHDNNTALIEFVDFGNTAVASVSDMRRLQESVLQLPTYSTHCMVRGVEALAEKMLDPEAVSTFKEKIGCGGEKLLKCYFIRQTGSVWEVSLEDNGEAVEVQIPVEDPEASTEKQVEDDVTPICSLREETENTETSPPGASPSIQLQVEECTDKEEPEEFTPDVSKDYAQVEEDKSTDTNNSPEKDLSSGSHMEEETGVDDKDLSSIDACEEEDLEITGESADGAVDGAGFVETADGEELDVSASLSEIESSSESLDVTYEGDSIEWSPILTETKPTALSNEARELSIIEEESDSPDVDVTSIEELLEKRGEGDSVAWGPPVSVTKAAQMVARNVFLEKPTPEVDVSNQDDESKELSIIEEESDSADGCTDVQLSLLSSQCEVDVSPEDKESARF